MMDGVDTTAGEQASETGRSQPASGPRSIPLGVALRAVGTRLTAGSGECYSLPPKAPFEQRATTHGFGWRRTRMCPWGRCHLLVAALVLALSVPARASFPDGFNHPEIQWFELESDHFVVVFSAGLDSTARMAIDILEASHDPICNFLGAWPEAKTTIVLSDFDDVGFNNFARRMEHVIYLSNPILNQARVDREQWLHHLLPHEYVHVVNGWSLRHYGKAIGPLTEWSGMELQPQWFTEGLAEYTASRQDKTESTFALQAARQNQLLYGGKLDIADARFDVIETSVVYKQGHSMCLYLAEKYGEDVFRRIIAAYGSTPQWDIAFRIATGDQVETFYRDWLQRLRQRADALPEPQLMSSTEAYPARLEAALGGKMSPDGQTIAVYGVEDWEDPIPGLFLMSSDGRFFHKIASNLDLYDSWKLSWSADSRYLMYTGRVKGRTGAVLNAAFVYDQRKEKGWKLNTGDIRLGEAELSPDGTRVAFVHYMDERAVLATMTAEGDDVHYLTADLPMDAFSPTWSPDGQKLAFSLVDVAGADIATIDADGTGLARLTNDAWPDQYPAWSPDGEAIAFVSYRQAGERSEAAVSAEAQGLAAAATNLYVIPSAGGELLQITAAVSGGAYYPTWTPDSQNLLFSLFRVRDATLRRVAVDRSKLVAEVPSQEAAPEVAEALAADQPVRVASLGTEGAAGVREPAAARHGLTVVAPSAVVSPTPSGPADQAAPVAAMSASPAAAAQDQRPPSERAVQRKYDAFARTRNFVTRPFNDEDGLGDRFGVRTRWSDPLQKHRFTAEAGYGSGASDQWTAAAGYLNSQTTFNVGANVFRRVPPLRGERGALVAESSTGFEMLAELPIATGGNAYVQDKVKFGFEFADHQPFATVGGVLRPAPSGRKVAGPSVGFERTQLFPARGSQEMSVKVTQSEKMFGADLDFLSIEALYLLHLYAPNPRQVVSLGAALSMFDGQDFTLTQVQNWLATAEVRYDWRLADQVLSRYTWPYLHVGPVNLSASYQFRDQINGNPSGLDLRDRARLEVTNEGYVSRNFTYQVRLGPTFYTGSNSGTDWRAELRFDWRELPF